VTSMQFRLRLLCLLYSYTLQGAPPPSHRVFHNVTCLLNWSFDFVLRESSMIHTPHLPAGMCAVCWAVMGWFNLFFVFLKFLRSGGFRVSCFGVGRIFCQQSEHRGTFPARVSSF
jgi:hypothetical protein